MTTWKGLLILAVLLGLSMEPTEAGKPTATIPVLLDTDIGDDIDDALALALALKLPQLDVQGITTVHGDAFTRALIVCRFLRAVGREKIPVAAGTGPQRIPDHQGQMQYGLCPSWRNRPEKVRAVEFLYRKLKANPGKLTLLAVGPLTNIAKLLTRHPECKPWIRRMVIMKGAIHVGYTGKPPVVAEWNVKQDVQAARTVLASGVPLLVVPLDATARLQLPEKMLQRIFAARTPLTNELHSLYQLWNKKTPTLFDPVAVALCADEKWCKIEKLHLEVNDKGITQIGKGKPNARVAMSIRKEAFLKWFVQQLAPGGPGKKIPLPITNRSRPVMRGKMPRRVHVTEDYETDIERRWWLAGLLETRNVPPGNKRACRGVLTNNFDGRMGNPRARYTAVIFNPVPGPPMGKNTRLSFRCWLSGTSKLRVQIYTLSKGYHRHLTLTDLPQKRWLNLTVDMTAARRPDGSGGPLSENERIDDIQFYTDPGVELLIDDILLYDAADVKEKRPFPRRVLFTGWFDTGRQGREWPGEFTIVRHRPPRNWKAAHSVAHKQGAWIRLSLRGPRPLGKQTRLRFNYHLSGAKQMRVLLVNRTAKGKHAIELRDPKQGEWTETTVDFTTRPTSKDRKPQPGDLVKEIHFLVPREGKLQVDDVLLYE